MAEGGSWHYNKQQKYPAGDKNFEEYARRGKIYSTIAGSAERGILDDRIRFVFPLARDGKGVSFDKKAVTEIEKFFSSETRFEAIIGPMKNNINLPTGQANPQHPMRMIESILQKDPKSGKSIYDKLSTKAKTNFKKEAGEILSIIDNYNKGHGGKEQIIKRMSDDVKSFVQKELPEVQKQIDNGKSTSIKPNEKATAAAASLASAFTGATPLSPTASKSEPSKDAVRQSETLKKLIGEWKNLKNSKQQKEIGDKIADMLPAGGASRNTGMTAMSQEAITHFLNQKSNVAEVKSMTGRYPELTSRLVNTAIDAKIPVNDPAIKSVIKSVGKEGVQYLRESAQKVKADISKEGMSFGKK